MQNRASFAEKSIYGVGRLVSVDMGRNVKAQTEKSSRNISTLHSDSAPGQPVVMVYLLDKILSLLASQCSTFWSVLIRITEQPSSCRT